MDRMNAGRIEDFLWGQIGPREQTDFLAACGGEAGFLRQLEQESAFEALFYDKSWGLQTAAAGLDKESEWAQLAVPMPAAVDGETSSLFPEYEWNLLVNRAFTSAAENKEKKRSATVTFPKFVRYLAAACLIGIVAGGIVWKQF